LNKRFINLFTPQPYFLFFWTTVANSRLALRWMCDSPRTGCAGRIASNVQLVYNKKIWIKDICFATSFAGTILRLNMVWPK